MTKDNCTREEGIFMLENAGFEIKIGNSNLTFSVWLNDKLLYGFSNIDWLERPTFIINRIIQYYSYNEGIKKGKETLQKDFKKILNE